MRLFLVNSYDESFSWKKAPDLWGKVLLLCKKDATEMFTALPGFSDEGVLV